MAAHGGQGGPHVERRPVPVHHRSEGQPHRAQGQARAEPLEERHPAGQQRRGARGHERPGDQDDRRHALRTIGLALAACEKSVQIVYERNLRPVEKMHQPWVSRVTGQLLAGVDPLSAVKYQILLLFLLAGSSGLASGGAVFFASRSISDKRERLRLDRFSTR